jgi:outer membrane protein TolC
MKDKVIQDLEAAVADTEAKIVQKKNELAALRAELRRYRKALGAVTGRPTSCKAEDSRRGEAHVAPGPGQS